MQATVKEVGRVDGPSLDVGDAVDPEQRAAPRRLYRVRDAQSMAARPSVSSMFVPHGSLMNAIAIPSAGTVL